MPGINLILIKKFKDFNRNKQDHINHIIHMKVVKIMLELNLKLK
jgi:hypothetical protein